MKTTVEFFTSHYGQCYIHIDNGPNYHCGQGDIHKLLFNLLGNRIQNEYIDGCTIFALSPSQLKIVINYFAQKEKDI